MHLPKVLLVHFFCFMLIISGTEQAASENEAEYAKHKKYIKQDLGKFKSQVGNESETEQG